LGLRGPLHLSFWSVHFKRDARAVRCMLGESTGRKHSLTLAFLDGRRDFRYYSVR
jgi:hypothetical protein